MASKTSQADPGSGLRRVSHRALAGHLAARRAELGNSAPRNAGKNRPASKRAAQGRRGRRRQVMKVALRVAALMALSACTAERVSDERQILQLEDDWARALETRDGPLLDRIVAEDFTFIEPDGSVKDRAAYLADRQSDIADIESFEIADVEVDVRGSSALVSGVAHIVERRQGRRYRFSLRWKEMWIKDAGRWQVLAGQATPVNGRWDEPFLLGDGDG